MSEAAGRALIDELTEAATRPEHVYVHAWRPGDVVFWDNRCLLHAGSGYDADRHRRYMRQTRVSGTCSSLQEGVRPTHRAPDQANPALDAARSGAI